MMMLTTTTSDFDFSSVGVISVADSAPTFTLGDVYVLEVEVDDGYVTDIAEVRIEVRFPALIMGTGAVMACGRTFLDPGGDEHYANELDVTMTLAPEVVTEKVQIEFTSFNTESPWDKLYIYDGATVDPNKLVGTYNGTTLPSTITSTSSDGKLTFRFDSDFQRVRSGWEATVSCITPITEFSDASYSFTIVDNVTANADVGTVYATAALPSSTLTYSITSQTLEDANVDVFTIVDVDQSGVNVGTIRVLDPVPTLTVGDMYTLVVSVNDGTSSTATTEVHIEVVPLSLIMSDGLVSTCSTTFLDPGGDKKHGDLLDITTTLAPVISTDKIHIEFTTFNLEPSSDCTFDRLKIYDGATTSAPLIGTYCGRDLPPIITSTSPDGTLTFYFHSDFDTNRPGWEATVSCVTPPISFVPTSFAYDNYSFYLSEGAAASAEVGTVYAIAYDPSSTLTYRILSQELNSSSINHFTIVNESRGGTHVGVIQVESPVPSFLVGSIYILVLEVVDDDGATANANVSIETRGEYIIMSDSATPVPACSVTFLDPGGSGNYSDNLDVTMTLTPSATKSVQIEFTSFNVEAFSSACDRDKLEIYNGATTSEPLIGTYCGTNLPPIITSTSLDGALTFRFYSNSNTNQSGWEAEVSCVTPPTSFAYDSYSFYLSEGTAASAEVGTVYAIAPDPSSTLTYRILSQELNSSSVNHFTIADEFRDPTHVGVIQVENPVPSFLVGSIYMLVLEVVDDDGATANVSIEITRNYDADDDGLIEISTFEQLDVIRYDLDGDGQPTAAKKSEWEAVFGTGSAADNDDATHNGGSIVGYKLVDNLDFNDVDGFRTLSKWADGGLETNGWNPIGNNVNPFTATFEGNDKTISNLYIDRATTNNVGLFGYLGTEGEIRKLGLVGGSVTGRNYVGCLVGYSNRGILSDCYATGNVETIGATGATSVDGYAGGLVGYNDRGTISGCHATGNAEVTGNNGLAGGLAGQNSNGTITACHATGNAKARGNFSYAGGLVGRNNTGPISNSYAEGSVTGAANAGGLVGRNTGPISNSYAEGSVTGATNGGGLVGENNATIIMCHATGNATGYDVGGLVGESSGTISACYATGIAKGTRKFSSTGGLVGKLFNTGIIAACYSTGDAIAIGNDGNTGGLVGANEGGSTIKACYSTGNAILATERGRTGSLVGYHASSTITACYSTGTANDLYGNGLVGGNNSGTITYSYFDYQTSSLSNTFSGAKSTSELQAPTDYTNIYANWNIDVDSSLPSGIDNGANPGDAGPDNPWYFGVATQYPVLKVDFDGNGDATVDEFGPQRITRFISTGYSFFIEADAVAITEVGTVHAIPADRNHTLTYTITSQTKNDVVTTPNFDFSIDSTPQGGLNVGVISVKDPLPTFTIGDSYTLEIEVEEASEGTAVTEVSIEIIPPRITMIDSSVPVPACSTTFLDPGGDENYAPNLDVTMTLAPSVPTDRVQIEFTAFDVDPLGTCKYDKLVIYNGATTSEPRIGVYCGTNLPPAITSSSRNGTLTFRFTSNYTTQRPGWEAEVSCVVPATQFISNSYRFYLKEGAAASTEVGTVYSDVANFSYTLSYSITSQTLGGDPTMPVAAFSIADVPQGLVNVGTILVLNPSSIVAGNVYILEVSVSDGASGTATTEVRIEVVRDYDTDDDGLIEVSDLEQLNAIRWDLDGDGQPIAANKSEWEAVFGTGSIADNDDAAHNGGSIVGYKLANNLNFSGTKWMNGGSAEDGWNPIGSDINQFTATFEGNDKTISNLYIDDSDRDYAGLFGYLGTRGEIRNLSIEGGSIVGKNFVGGLVGSQKGTIENCHATVDVTAPGNGVSAGGLVGENNGTIRDSHATGDINAEPRAGLTYVGGLVGNNKSTISNCYASGDVAGSYAGGLVGWYSAGEIRDSHASGDVTGSYIGGLVGESEFGITISNCYATGNVMRYATGSGNAGGGLVGRLKGTVVASHATGSVTGGLEHAGGLVGNNKNGTIHACYATGDATTSRAGSDVGGLVGRSNGTISACYAIGTATAIGNDSNAGGLVGRSNGTISACYAIGTATAIGNDSNAGGLVGKSEDTIKACYSRGNATSSSGGGSIGSLVGDNSGAIITCYSTGTANDLNGNGLVGDSNSGTITDSYFDYQTSSLSNTFSGAKSTSKLQTPAAYSTGIYANWNVDVDANLLPYGIDDGDNPGDVAPDNPWDFGTNNQYPALKIDFNQNGDATVDEFGTQERDAIPLPSFTETSYTFTQNENVTIGTPVSGAPAIAASDPENNPLTYNLTDDGGGRFQIDPTSGVISNAQLIDYAVLPLAEQNNGIVLEAQVSDGRGGTATADVTITITDVDEASNTPPSFTETSYIFMQNEGVTIGTPVSGAPAIAASDPENNPLYSLTDDGSGRFQIDPTSGVISNAQIIDYEALPLAEQNNGIMLEVQVSDNATPPNAATADVTITITDISDEPVILDFTPTTGPPNTIVVITGRNFNAIPENNIVHFGDAKASTPSQASTTSLTVTVPQGAQTGPIHVTANGTGTSEEDFTVITEDIFTPVFNVFGADKSLYVYPNPTSGEIEFAGLSAAKTYVCKVYSLLGQEMFSGTVKHKIDLSNLVEGQYILSLHAEGKVLLRTQLLILRK